MHDRHGWYKSKRAASGLLKQTGYSSFVIGHQPIEFIKKANPNAPSKRSTFGFAWYGAPSGTRTQDPLIKSQLLSLVANTNGIIDLYINYVRSCGIALFSQISVIASSKHLAVRSFSNRSFISKDCSSSSGFSSTSTL